MKKRLLCIFLTLCFCLSLLPASALAEEFGGTEEVVIFYTNDVHTYIDGQIRYSQIAALKASYDNALLLDAGDHIQGTAYGSMDKGETIVELMNAAGYDAATFGNHEFDYGMDGCLQTVERAQYAYLSCNFYHEEDGVTGDTVTQPYEIFEVDGVKIAVIGITTPESFTSSTPAYFQDEDGNYIYGIAGGEDGQALYDAVQEAIDQVSEQADYVIALGHLGIDVSSEPWRSVDVIANTTGLDAFIDGHSHSTVPMKEVEDQEGNTVILTQTGEYFGAVGKMTISDGQIKTELLTAEDLADVTPDETVKTLEERWISEMEEVLGQKIGSADVTLDNYGANGDRLVRRQETNTGDFVTDALYYLFDSMGMDVDVAIMNGGGIRNEAVTGALTYKICKEIHTFGNVACLQEVTGQQILDALEWGAREAGKAENGGFLQVSGLTYEIDLSVENTTQVDEKGVWIAGPTERYRVHNVKIYDRETDSYQPLDPNETYKLAGYNYTLRDLGDGFAMFEDATNILDYVMEDYMVLANYVQGFENGVVAADNSPLKEKYSGLLIDYSSVNGSGRIGFSGRPANSISYDSNGGEGDPEGSEIFGDSVTVTLEIPVRENYFFAGWNTEPDGSGTELFGGDTYYFADFWDNGGCEATLYAQWTQIYVAGVEVTESNANDVLGDGTVTYDPQTNTLTLNNADITSSGERKDGYVAAIFATGNLNIHVEGENRVVALDATLDSTAIDVRGNLKITGGGKLTAQSGKVTGVATGEDDDQVNSIGIYVKYTLTIRQAHVVAIGGDASITAGEGWTENAKAYSEGIYVYGDMVLEGATLEASSATASGLYAFSAAVRVNESATVSGSTVTAVGGNVTAITYPGKESGVAYSHGLCVNENLLLDQGSTLKGIGGTAEANYEARSYGVLVFGDMEVQNALLTACGGEVRNTDPRADREYYFTSIGCQVEGSLWVTDNGVIDAVGGKVTAIDPFSCGLAPFGDYMVIDGGDVTAVAGDIIGVIIDGYAGYGESSGVYSESEITISGLGSLTATGGKVEGDKAYSYGIRMFYGGIGVFDGYLTATASDAKGLGAGKSYGITVEESNTFYVYDHAARVEITSGNATAEDAARSAALIAIGDVGFEAGTIILTSGKAEQEDGHGESYGMFVQAEKDEDGTVSGGNVIIRCDNIETKSNGYGFSATNVTISSSGGCAIYAEGSIEIEEMMIVKTPENGVVAGQGEWNETFDWYDYYIIVDSEGKPAQSLSVELLTYKIKVEQGTSSTMAVPVPAGWSANEAYCEKFGIEDMAQVLQGKKNGFVFGGFYTDEACTDGNEYDFNIAVTEDITIYTKWIAVYTPSVEQTDGGETTVDGKNVQAGDTVTITVKLEQGKEVAAVTVTDESGNAVAVTANEDGTYSFIQPSSQVTVKVIYQAQKEEERPSDDDDKKPAVPTAPTEPSQSEEPQENGTKLWVTVVVALVVVSAGVAVAVYFIRKSKE